MTARLGILLTCILVLANNPAQAFGLSKSWEKQIPAELSAVRSQETAVSGRQNTIPVPPLIVFQSETLTRGDTLLMLRLNLKTPGVYRKNVLEYTGQEKESDLGLVYFGARWYDPETGRFCQVDPLRQFFNPYSYGGNNPIVMVDTDGLSFWKRLGLLFSTGEWLSKEEYEAAFFSPEYGYDSSVDMTLTVTASDANRSDPKVLSFSTMESMNSFNDQLKSRENRLNTYVVNGYVFYHTFGLGNAFTARVISEKAAERGGIVIGLGSMVASNEAGLKDPFGSKPFTFFPGDTLLSESSKRMSLDPTGQALTMQEVVTTFIYRNEGEKGFAIYQLTPASRGVKGIHPLSLVKEVYRGKEVLSSDLWSVIDGKK